MSDAELIRASAGKPELFEELVNRYQRPFLRKAVSILKDDDDAYDAVQEAFVRIYAAGKRFESRPGAEFSSWAYAILINQCFTAYRKKQKRAAVSLDREPGLMEALADSSSVDELEGHMLSDEVAVLLSRLPVLLRRAVELHFLKGLPQKEVAEREGVSPNVIRQRIHRAKKALRDSEFQFAML